VLAISRAGWARHQYASLTAESVPVSVCRLSYEPAAEANAQCDPVAVMGCKNGGFVMRSQGVGGGRNIGDCGQPVADGGCQLGKFCASIDEKTVLGSAVFGRGSGVLGAAVVWLFRAAAVSTASGVGQIRGGPTVGCVRVVLVMQAAAEDGVCHDGDEQQQFGEQRKHAGSRGQRESENVTDCRKCIGSSRRKRGKSVKKN